VAKFKTFPRKDDLKLFIFQRIVSKQNVTLSVPIQRFVGVVSDGYELIMDKIDFGSFISIALGSIPLRTPDVMESGKTEAPPPAVRRPTRIEPPPQRESQSENRIR
jgi:hypothetical protein